MRIIIAGSREGVKYSDVCNAMVKASEEGVVPYDFGKIKCILCGMAEGADLLGKAWAEHHGIRVWEMPADREDISGPHAVIMTRKNGSKYNAIAGHERNQAMVDVAHAAVYVRRLGKSSGTDDCIRRAKKKGIPIYIHHLP